MSETRIHQEYVVSGNNFASAGSASEEVKSTLKKIGVASSDIRRVAIAMYEGEINMVIHAGGGVATVDIYLDRVEIVLADKGKGIENVELAMTPGWSTAPEDIRALGFGAGMGLPNMKKYTDINAEAIDSWNKEGWEWGVPMTHEQFCRAKEGEWKILLTPTKIMPRTWLPQSLKGLKILGLASGGAQQIPVFAALGARCSVLDYSPSQIKSEIDVAAREGYEVEAIRGDMTERLPFDDETFDIIVHPVSNCYIKEVGHVFNECYRVLKRGGILVCGLDNGINYITDDEVTIGNSLPINVETLPCFKNRFSTYSIFFLLRKQALPKRLSTNLYMAGLPTNIAM